MISDERFDALVKRAWDLSAQGPTECQGPAFNSILHLLISNEYEKLKSKTEPA